MENSRRGGPPTWVGQYKLSHTPIHFGYLLISTWTPTSFQHFSQINLPYNFTVLRFMGLSRQLGSPRHWSHWITQQILFTIIENSLTRYTVWKLIVKFQENYLDIFISPHQLFPDDSSYVPCITIILYHKMIMFHITLDEFPWKFAITANYFTQISL